MKRIFICSPFRGNIEANVRLARKACMFAISQGQAPFAPHLYLPFIGLDDNNEQQRALGISVGIEFLKACEEIWVFGPETSGMRQEVAMAQTLGINIRKFPIEALTKED